MRCAKRADNCSVSDCDEVFISMVIAFVYWRVRQYRSQSELNNCIASVLNAQTTVGHAAASAGALAHLTRHWENP
jgi:hypothetical protein